MLELFIGFLSYKFR